MDIQESEEFLKENEAKHRKKRALLLGIILCILFVAFLAAVIFYLQIQDAKTFKMFINNKKYAVSKNFVHVEEDKKNNKSIRYVNLEELCKALGYTFQAGSIALTEGENLYSITTNYEMVDIDVDKMTFDKYPNYDKRESEDLKNTEKQVYGGELTLRTPKDTREIFQLKNPLKKINTSVYISSADLSSLLSIGYSWSEDNIYRLRIYTLGNLYTKYGQLAVQNGYTNISADYENIRALVDGFLVVEKNSKYGVIDFNGDPIIEAKYDRLLYSQNAQEFFAYANSKAGLIDKDGKQLIKLTTYQDISILDQNLDQEHRLYKVSKDGKFGVVTRSGEELIHTGYDQIGLDPTVELYKKLDDAIILYDKFIPVKLDNGWGYYNLETGELGGYDEQASKFNFAGIGCDISSSKTSTNQKSVVLIPKEVGIRGVVLMYQSGQYGIYDCNANSITVTCIWSRIYAETNNKTGETLYYLDLNGDKKELKQFLEENNLITENEEADDETANTDDTSEDANTPSLTERMNNLSTQGKLNDTANEDEQYFEENTSETEENPEEDTTEGDSVENPDENGTEEENTEETNEENQ